MPNWTTDEGVSLFGTEDPHCGCAKCLDRREPLVELFGHFIPASHTRMVVCQICGNKRCPHAADHNNACTNSNEPGQPGSNYS